jgi:hypothetical protein
MAKIKVDWRDRRISAPGPYLCLCLTEAAFLAALADMGVKDRPSFMATPHAHATTHHFDHKNGGAACIVTLSAWEGRSPIEVAGLLVHEAVHVWQRYCNHIGEHRPAAEQEAYGIQAIAQELMQSFVEQTAC